MVDVTYGMNCGFWMSVRDQTHHGHAKSKRQWRMDILHCSSSFRSCVGTSYYEPREAPVGICVGPMLQGVTCAKMFSCAMQSKVAGQQGAQGAGPAQPKPGQLPSQAASEQQVRQVPCDALPRMHSPIS